MVSWHPSGPRREGRGEGVASVTVEARVHSVRCSSRASPLSPVPVNSSKINDWLSLVANVAVVGGIIFLGIEVRQNNELLRSESRQALIANDVTSLSANIEHPAPFARLVAGDSLSAEDQLQLSFMFSLDLRNREFEYFQYTNGLLDEETWRSYLNVLRLNHSTELGRRWWDEIGRGFVDPDFAVLVDEVLADSEADDTYRRMSTWAN